MTYADVIEENSKKISRPWWAKNAFHYTDINNVLSILKTGYLFSRVSAKHQGVMSNDNAAQQVIDMTSSGATSYVRFYFRPLTPTQFHNEGYKHTNLRYCKDTNANVPVPVFFVFDLETLLNHSETRFSEKSLAGYGDSLLTGVEAFAKLNFDQIYRDGYMENPEEEKKYRQAEIVFPGKYEIKSSLKAIVCRNDVERKTLINLLRESGEKLFTEYQKYICVCDECFERNGLFITACEYSGSTATIVFSNTRKKKSYIQKYKEGNSELLVSAHARFDWVKKGTILLSQSCEFNVDYENQDSLKFTGLTKPNEAAALYMRIEFEKRLMCYMCWQIAEAAIL